MYFHGAVDQYTAGTGRSGSVAQGELVGSRLGDFDIVFRVVTLGARVRDDSNSRSILFLVDDDIATIKVLGFPFNGSFRVSEALQGPLGQVDFLFQKFSLGAARFPGLDYLRSD